MIEHTVHAGRRKEANLGFVDSSELLRILKYAHDKRNPDETSPLFKCGRNLMKELRGEETQLSPRRLYELIKQSAMYADHEDSPQDAITRELLTDEMIRYLDGKVNETFMGQLRIPFYEDYLSLGKNHLAPKPFS